MKFLTGKILRKYNGNESEVIIPEGITHIDKSIFAENKTMEKVVFPQSMRNVGMYAFEGGSNLKEIKFNYGLKEIGDYAFCECRCFINCKKLSNIIIPEESDILIMEKAFEGCDGLV